MTIPTHYDWYLPTFLNMKLQVFYRFFVGLRYICPKKLPCGKTCHNFCVNKVELKQTFMVFFLNEETTPPMLVNLFLFFYSPLLREKYNKVTPLVNRASFHPCALYTVMMRRGVLLPLDRNPDSGTGFLRLPPAFIVYSFMV